MKGLLSEFAVRRLAPGTVIVALLIGLSGCPLDHLEGPSEVHPGDIATFTMTIHGTYPDTTQVFVTAQIPADWEFVEGSFQGISSGQPVSGTGAPVDEDTSNCGWPDLPSGFQRLNLTDGKSYDESHSDYANVTISFRVLGKVGVFPVTFWAWGLPDDACSYAPQTVQVTVKPSEVPATRPLGRAVLILAMLGAGVIIIRRHMMSL